MQRVLFGEEILSDYTKEIYQDGEVVLSNMEDVKATVDESIKHSPKLIIERLGNKIEVELYTNNYKINDEEKELKTVVPYINGKYFIPQELITEISNLKEKKEEKLDNKVEKKVEQKVEDIKENNEDLEKENIEELEETEKVEITDIENPKEVEENIIITDSNEELDDNIEEVNEEIKENNQSVNDNEVGGLN